MAVVEPRIAEVRALLAPHLEPILPLLGLEPGQLAAGRPTVFAAVSFRRELGAGKVLWLRYTFPRGTAQLILEQELLTRTGTAPTQLVWRGDRSRFIDKLPADQRDPFLQREAQVLLSDLVVQGSAALEREGLGQVVQAARQDPGWQRIASERAALLARRDVARELEGWQPAQVVFASEKLVHVALGRDQLTFKCDGRGLGRGDAVEVGGLWQSWSGGLNARRLRVNGVERTAG